MTIAMGAPKTQIANTGHPDQRAYGRFWGAYSLSRICHQMEALIRHSAASFLRTESRIGFAFPTRLDLSETDKSVVAKLDVPGMDEKDIDVTIRSGALVVTGQREQSSEEKAGNYHRMERPFGSFRRVVPLPCDVAVERIEARLNKGVLTIDLPKAVQPHARAQKIAVTPSLF